MRWEGAIYAGYPRPPLQWTNPISCQPRRSLAYLNSQPVEKLVFVMLREGVLLTICLVFAYVCTKPTVHHRAKRWEDFPNLTFTFDCTDRAVGFYADTEHHCQIFHMCDEDGRRIPYICANDTSFNQQYRVCDWDYNVDCGEAQSWYYLNELTYVTDPPKEFTKSP